MLQTHVPSLQNLTYVYFPGYFGSNKKATVPSHIASSLINSMWLYWKLGRICRTATAQQLYLATLATITSRFWHGQQEY